LTTTLLIGKTESVFDELKDMHDRIASRAYDIFARNGRSAGRELDDWFEAKHELVWEPSIELSETDKTFVLDMAIPGVDAKDIDMAVTPEYLVVKAGFRHGHEEGKRKIHACEFESGSLFRSIQFPKTINPDRVKAELHEGILRITAEIAVDQRKKIEIKAA
jgi:HSP20 family molecular chaperone IbpA